MAWTQADITALEQAIAKGVKRVEFADQVLQFQDLAEMRSLLQQMRREVNSPRRYHLAATSKGTG